MTTDPIYLDGSQPYHRHVDSDRIIGSEDCGVRRPEVRVLVFDDDALAAHDEAIRQQADQGLPDAPRYLDGEWEFVILEPVEPGQEATDSRVMAGWTTGGEFRRYCTPERLAAAVRTAFEDGNLR